eukprot:c11984_g1_i1.p1 GENE.c11984_g1_i1~~c11984_g1_i1.p1  ORF type:complete len:1557 (+),score=366.77 c11984_g1_i1:80-4750(+)
MDAKRVILVLFFAFLVADPVFGGVSKCARPDLKQAIQGLVGSKTSPNKSSSIIQHHCARAKALDGFPALAHVIDSLANTKLMHNLFAQLDVSHVESVFAARGDKHNKITQLTGEQSLMQTVYVLHDGNVLNAGCGVMNSLMYIVCVLFTLGLVYSLRWYFNNRLDSRELDIARHAATWAQLTGATWFVWGMVSASCSMYNTTCQRAETFFAWGIAALACWFLSVSLHTRYEKLLEAMHTSTNVNAIEATTPPAQDDDDQQQKGPRYAQYMYARPIVPEGAEQGGDKGMSAKMAQTLSAQNASATTRVDIDVSPQQKDLDDSDEITPQGPTFSIKEEEVAATQTELMQMILRIFHDGISSSLGWALLVVLFLDTLMFGTICRIFGKFSHETGCGEGFRYTSMPLTGQLGCVAVSCPTGSVSAGHGVCVCATGYFGVVTWGDDGQYTNGCSPCAIGKYTDIVNSDYCSLCPAGKSSTGVGSSACVDCAVGTWAEKGDERGCVTVDCPASLDFERYVDAHGTPWCRCKPGFFGQFYLQIAQNTFVSTSPTGLVTACTPCSGSKLSGGPITSATYTKSCEYDRSTGCPPGSYLKELSRACVSCTLGTDFQSEWGQQQCSPCFVCNPTTSKAASNCTLTTDRSCSCIAPFYFSAATQECTTCLKGYYTDANGATSCKACTVGTYADQRGLTACKACADNTFADVRASELCTSCAPCTSSEDTVQLCTATTAAVCHCKAGFGGTTCTTATTSSNCAKCTAGKYNTGTCYGCTDCALGKFSLEGVTECTSCEVGKYSASRGSSECSTCSPGKYTTVTGSSSCVLCVTCTASSESPATACSLASCVCSAGYGTVTRGCSALSADGTTSVAGDCTVCAPGKYNIGTCSPCQACPVGKFSGDSGSAACTDCLVGSYADTTGSSACKMCDAAKEQYASTAGASACSTCITCNSFNETVSTLCSTTTARVCSCKTGYGGSCTTASSATTCALCGKGLYSSASQCGACARCSSGTYSDLLGATACTACGVGKYATSSGETECKACVVGKYANVTSSRLCSSCELGKYADTTGLTSCTDCATSYYADEMGLSTCKHCYDCGANENSGTCSKSGGPNCLCKVGFGGTCTNATAKSTCVACASGKFSSIASCGPCTDCEPGKFSAAGATTCTSCPKGKFSNVSGASVCQECASGTSASSIGTTQCTNCTAGTYGATTGLSVCSSCVTPLYTDTAAQTACKTCITCNSITETETTCSPTSGTTCRCKPGYGGSCTTATQTTTCAACALGTYSAGGCNACIACSPGTIANTTMASQCTPCPIGFISIGAGQSVCVACPPGTFSNTTGLAQCYPCPIGTYSTVSNATSCMACPSGKFTTSTRSTSCTACAVCDVAIERTVANCSATANTVCGCAYGYGGSACTTQTTNSTCAACTAGYFGNGTCAPCTKCAPGTYTTSSAQQTCTPCATGTYSNQEGQTQCQACATNQYAHQTGMTACLACFGCDTSKELVQVVCTATTEPVCVCRPGTAGQCSNPLQTSRCEACPAGKYSLGSCVGCTDCALNKKSQAGATSCT